MKPISEPYMLQQEYVMCQFFRKTWNEVEFPIACQRMCRCRIPEAEQVSEIISHRKVQEVERPA